MEEAAGDGKTGGQYKIRTQKRSASFFLGLSAWRSAFSVRRCGNGYPRNGQNKPISRTHSPQETGSDYIGLAGMSKIDIFGCSENTIGRKPINRRVTPSQDYFPALIFFTVVFSILRSSYTLTPPLPTGACAKSPTFTTGSTGRWKYRII